MQNPYTPPSTTLEVEPRASPPFPAGLGAIALMLAGLLSLGHGWPSFFARR